MGKGGSSPLSTLKFGKDGFGRKRSIESEKKRTAQTAGSATLALNLWEWAD
jgi:hypothetical protein